MTVRTKKRYHEHEAFWYIRKVNMMQSTNLEPAFRCVKIFTLPKYQYKYRKENKAPAVLRSKTVRTMLSKRNNTTNSVLAQTNDMKRVPLSKRRTCTGMEEEKRLGF